MDVANVDAGSEHICSERTDGTAWCWGRGSYGLLGNGVTGDSFVPVQVVGSGGGGFLHGF
ncbi:hypothetical protein ACFL51_00020 [Myxococcota bacterium]